MLNSPMFQNLLSLICFIPLFYVIIIETSSLILLFPIHQTKAEIQRWHIELLGFVIFFIFSGILLISD